MLEIIGQLLAICVSYFILKYLYIEVIIKVREDEDM